jgi:hypothetical protein
MRRCACREQDQVAKLTAENAALAQQLQLAQQAARSLRGAWHEVGVVCFVYYMRICKSLPSVNSCSK